jgi:hypothetical protein
MSLPVWLSALICFAVAKWYVCGLSGATNKRRRFVQLTHPRLTSKAERRVCGGLTREPGQLALEIATRSAGSRSPRHRQRDSLESSRQSSVTSVACSTKLSQIRIRRGRLAAMSLLVVVHPSPSLPLRSRSQSLPAADSELSTPGSTSTMSQPTGICFSSTAIPAASDSSNLIAASGGTLTHSTHRVRDLPRPEHIMQLAMPTWATSSRGYEHRTRLWHSIFRIRSPALLAAKRRSRTCNVSSLPTAWRR